MTQFLYIIFFLSGTAALIFETIWFRLAGLLLGNSVWSASLILGGFMGGLALGNGLISRYGDRLKRPVRFYAALEFWIGATGMMLVFILPRLQNWLVPLLSPFLDHPSQLNLLRFGIAFLLIIVPTTAMGATLPVLLKSLYRFNPHFGSVLGGLYGLNTLGAVSGALAGELILIKIFGITGTGLIAGFMNMLAGLLALKISSVVDPQTGGIQPETETSLEKGIFSLDVVRLLFCSFLAGAVLLALEVVWFRFLILFYRGTSLTFAAMLSLVLAGIGVGGLIGSLLFKNRFALHHHARSIAATGGLFLVITYMLFGKIFYAVQPAEGGLSITSFILFASFLMFPVSLASGLLFTSIGHSLKEEVSSETHAAGIVTLANTVGALVGSFAGAFLLLPGQGMENSLFIMALAYGVIALLIPSRSTVMGRRSKLLSFAVLAVYLMFMALFPFGHMEKYYFAVVDRKIEKGERIAVREALTETIFYYRYNVMEEPFYYRLVTNGYSMSGTLVEAKRYMKLYVYLPLALKPDMRKALLISYGVGSTAKALTDTEQLETIDVVDISRDIIEMSSIVYPEAHDNPLSDERVSVYIEDGRFFLQSREDRYDLITGEPPPPKMAGIVNLYSREYFGLVRERLTEGGIVSYWLPVHSLLEEDTKSIIKAFCTIFEDCTLWSGSGLDWMLIGTRNASPPYSAELFSKQWEDPRIAGELTRLGIENPSQLGSLFMAGPAHLKQFVRNTQPLTDDYPLRLSIEAPPGNRRSPLYAAMMNEDEALVRFQKSAFIRKMWPGEIMADALRYFYFQRIIKGVLIPEYRDDQYYVFDDLYRVLTTSPLKTLPLWMMGTSRRELEIARQQPEEGRFGKNVQLLFFLEAVSERDYAGAVRIMESVIRKGKPDENLQHYPMYLFAVCMSGQIDRADDIASRMAPLLSQDAGMMIYWKWMNITFGLRIPTAAGS